MPISGIVVSAAVLFTDWRLLMAEVRAVDGGGGVVQLPGPAVEALMSLDSIAVTPSTAPASPCTITILSSGYLK